jgi:hypothetical protein
MTYEAPTITELGSVADFTREDRWAWDHDGWLLHRGGGTTTQTS